MDLPIIDPKLDSLALLINDCSIAAYTPKTNNNTHNDQVVVDSNKCEHLLTDLWGETCLKGRRKRENGKLIENNCSFNNKKSKLTIDTNGMNLTLRANNNIDNTDIDDLQEHFDIHAHDNSCYLVRRHAVKKWLDSNFNELKHMRAKTALTLLDKSELIDFAMMAMFHRKLNEKDLLDLLYDRNKELN